jgi:hypothetical protein
LVSAYKPAHYYFEVLECIRRLLLASVIGIVASDSAASAVLGILISQFFLAIFLKLKPFKDVDDSWLATVLSYSLTLFFLAALMIKVCEDIKSKNETMSQQDTFSLYICT